jgi:hypothetical protein
VRRSLSVARRAFSLRWVVQRVERLNPPRVRCNASRTLHEHQEQGEAPSPMREHGPAPVEAAHLGALLVVAGRFSVPVRGMRSSILCGPRIGPTRLLGEKGLNSVVGTVTIRKPEEPPLTAGFGAHNLLGPSTSRHGYPQPGR